MKFPLESGQLELLIAFRNTDDLSSLAKSVHRDPSVVSRQLKRISETADVLRKERGRWVLTDLGESIVRKTEGYIKELGEVLKPRSIDIPEMTALLVINAQKAMQNQSLGIPGPEGARQNLQDLIQNWRRAGRRLIHIKHTSTNPDSAFFSQAESSHFIEDYAPIGDEPVFEKTRSSAFSAQNLEEYLESQSLSSVLLAGFTASECIAATAIHANLLEFECYVAQDATVTFPIKGPNNRTYSASELHELTIASLHANQFHVLDTAQIIAPNR